MFHYEITRRQGNYFGYIVHDESNMKVFMSKNNSLRSSVYSIIEDYCANKERNYSSKSIQLIDCGNITSTESLEEYA